MISFPSFVQIVQRFPPYEMMGWLLLLTVAIAVGIGLLRSRESLVRSIPLFLYLILSAFLLLSNRWQDVSGRRLPVMLGLCLLLGVAHFVVRRWVAMGAREEAGELAEGDPPARLNRNKREVKEGSDSEERSESKQRGWRVSLSPAGYYLSFILVFFSMFLLYRLSSFAGSLLTWESPITRDYGQIYHSGKTPTQFFIEQTRWDDGLLGRSENSFLYGAPTYALYNWFGFTVWNMRISSVAAALLGLVVLYLLARRFFDRTTAAGATVFLATNALFLYFARYGGSPAGNILGVLLALYAFWLLLVSERNPLWVGPLFGMAVCLATLQYATGRLAMVMMLAWGSVYLMVQGGLWLDRRIRTGQWPGWDWRRPIGWLLALVVIWGFWKYQEAHDTHGNFQQARGEQFLYFLKDPYYLKDYLKRDIQPRELSTFHKAELAFRVVERTLPQYLSFWTPSLNLEIPGQTVLAYDPPTIRLYFPETVPFLFLGLLYSLTKWRDFKHSFLLIWVAVTSGPVLLTNRVDAIRLFLFVIPLSFWAAWGVRECALALRDMRVPKPLQHGMACAVLVTLLIHDVYALTYPRPPKWEPRIWISEEFERIEGPITLVVEANHMEVSLLYLHLLERERLDPSRKAQILSPGVFDSLIANPQNPSVQVLSNVQREIQGSTALFYPSDRFQSVVQKLAARGANVAALPSGAPRFYRVTWGPVTEPPSDPARDLREGEGTQRPGVQGLEKVYASSMEPLKVEQGFLPPRMDRTCTGGDITMGGETYLYGIGMHSWCQMTFPVPPGALAFEAKIGLSDQGPGCADRASVTFELQDENGRVLYDSEIFTGRDEPRDIRIPLAGPTQLSLVVTEAANGRDCDHANWANAAFLVAPSASPDQGQ